MANKIVNKFSCKGKRKNKAAKKGPLRKGAGLPRGKKQGKLSKRTYPLPRAPCRHLACCTTELALNK